MSSEERWGAKLSLVFSYQNALDGEVFVFDTERMHQQMATSSRLRCKNIMALKNWFFSLSWGNSSLRSCVLQKLFCMNYLLVGHLGSCKTLQTSHSHLKSQLKFSLATAALVQLYEVHYREAVWESYTAICWRCMRCNACDAGMHWGLVACGPFIRSFRI